MSDVVVDTNVAVVANGRGPSGTSGACIRSCLDRLRRLRTGDRFVVDDGWRILREYRGRLSESGQPGPGDAFLKWALQNVRNPRRCVLVTIHPRAADDEDYEEFPDTPGLHTFDRSDRKFVAAAAAHGPGTPILQATDAGWWQHRAALKRAGVTVDFICPEDIRRSRRAGGRAR